MVLVWSWPAFRGDGARGWWRCADGQGGLSVGAQTERCGQVEERVGVSTVTKPLEHCDGAETFETSVFRQVSGSGAEVGGGSV